MTKPPLLGPPFETQTPEVFKAYVESLHSEPQKRKQAPRGPKLAGKVAKAATAKRPGKYEIKFPALGTCAEFAFAKDRTMGVGLETLSAFLRCDVELLRKFLTVKKFVISP